MKITVTPATTNRGSLACAAVIFNSKAQSCNNVGLLPIITSHPGYRESTSRNLVSLPGATRGQKDVFIQIDYLATHDFITSGGAVGHSHKPKQEALDMVGDAFNAQGIHLHIDCGNCYQGDPYIIAGGLGGNVIDEDTVTCQDNPAATPPFFCAFPGQPVTG